MNATFTQYEREVLGEYKKNGYNTFLPIINPYSDFKVTTNQKPRCKQRG